MTALDWAVLVAVVAAVWLAVGLAVVGPVGRRLHRNAHRQLTVDPRDCPPWCARERAAALLRQQRGGL